MRFLRRISLLTILALLCAMVPASLAEDFAVDMEEEDFVEETVEEVDSLDLSDLMFEDEVSAPENNDLVLFDAGLCEADGEEQVAPAVAANASSDFDIDEDGVLVRYTGFDKNVTIPSSVKEIGVSAFSWCDTLVSVIIPNNVTRIQSYAFSYCEKLESITIPSSVTSIDRNTFCDSDNFIIRGIAGSYVEKYANGLGIPFNAPIISFDESIDFDEEEEKYEGIIIHINQAQTLKAVQRPSDLARTLRWSSSNTKVATVDQNGNVKGIQEGSATITVATADGKGKAANIEVYVPEPLTVEIKYDESEIEMGKTLEFSAYLYDSYTDDDNIDMPVTWSVSDKTILSITKTGKDSEGDYCVTLKGLKPGKATLTATTANGGKDSITVEVCRPEADSVTINQKGPITLKAGKKYTLTAKVLPAEADQKVTWYSNDTDVAIVSKTGIVTAVSGGEATIWVETDNYCSDSIEIRVPPVPPTRVKLNRTKATVGVSDILVLSTSLLPKNATSDCTFTSSNKKVISVGLAFSDAAFLVAHKKGKATITVKTENGKKAKCVVTVKAAPKKVTLYKGSKKLKNKQTLTLKKGKTLKLKAKLPAKTAASLTWTSSKPTVATVDENGKITALKPGTTTITVKTHNKKTAKVKIKVK